MYTSRSDTLSANISMKKEGNKHSSVERVQSLFFLKSNAHDTIYQVVGKGTIQVKSIKGNSILVFNNKDKNGYGQV